MPTTRTFSPSPRHVDRRWYVVDADGAILGRLASEVAKLLRGKHKPIFAPHVDTGDHVVVVNARGIRLTGGKEQKKIYYRHSQYPGGLREVDYERLLAQRPVVAVEKAVRGMLPKNRLGRQMLRKLSVYEGPDHPHQAQMPEPLALGAIPRWEGLPEPKPVAPPKKPTKTARAGSDKAKKGTGPQVSPRTGPRAKRPSTAKASTKGEAGKAPAKRRLSRKAVPTEEAAAESEPSNIESEES
jgi:large subunit ribosomal protein L13